jgi:hypothetical protein
MPPWRLARGDEGADAMAPNRARLAEIHVELALMADIATFPYEFVAQADGAALRLSGYVPNDTVRRRALQIAAAHSPLPVTDALELHVRSDSPYWNWPAGYLPRIVLNQLQRAAEAVLAEAFPDETAYFSVQAAPHGEVTVRGTIGSYEKKLAVSNVLRAVHGCSAVYNELDVRSVVLHGRRFTVLTAEGKRYVPAEYIGPGPMPVTVARPVPDPAPAPYANGVSPARAQEPAALAGGLRVSADYSSPYMPTQTVSGGVVIQQTSYQQAGFKGPQTIEWVQARPEPSAENKTQADQKPAPQPKVRAEHKPQPKSKPAAVCAEPRKIAPGIAPAPSAKQVLHPADLPKATPPPVLAAQACTPAAHWADVECKAKTMAAAPPPACPRPEPTHPAPAPSAPVPCAVKQCAAVAAGPAKPRAQTPGTPAVAPESVQRAVREACAAIGADARIVMRSANSILVRLTVHSEEEGMWVSQQVFQHPDMQAYRVDLDIKVAR